MERLGRIVRFIRKTRMTTIVITLPQFFDGEAERIAQLLHQGNVNLLHVRKPHSSREALEKLIQAIPQDLHQRLVLHDYHELALQYQLRGIHLNSRNPLPPDGWTGKTSISCHSLDELAEKKKQPFAYLSLSPIFDSISKQGYKVAFSAQELEQACLDGIIDHRVMALGGITFDRLHIIEKMGFGGAMILGDAWK